jgi:RNA polymerase sigma-70 factor (ECF subfamily)
MLSWRPDAALVQRLHRRARADRWSVTRDAFAAALERSVARAFTAQPASRDVEQYLDALHLEDLALACACAAGHEPAWDHFIVEFRPVLYRAADAIDASGGAREAADSLYGELYGLTERDGERRSHLRYFHGRSSLATWLRAVLSQRYVDRLRAARRMDPLPEDESPNALPAPPRDADPLRHRALAVMQRAITAAVAALAPRDRLRLSCYYAQSLTLAEIGRMLGEHEATVSRHLTRVRRKVRSAVERQLRDVEQMSDAEIQECFTSVVDDPGSLDVAAMIGAGADRKEAALDRSR